MSFKTITVILLVSCLGAMGTPLGGPEEPLQEGRVAAVRVPLTITDVRWLLTDNSATVQICTSDDLPPGLPTLIYDDGTGSSVDIDGAIEQANPKCATFSKEVAYKYTVNPTRYELIVADASDPFSLLGRGVTTFAITVGTTLLACGDGSSITKITWSGVEIIPDDYCVDEQVNLDKACYHNGDLTGTEFCFTVNDGVNDVTVCLNGPLDASSDTGTVSTNYFYYGPESLNGAVDDATLSLTMDPLAGTQLRAIVRLAEDPPSSGTPGIAHIYDCPSSECNFAQYERKLATYQVCVEAMSGDPVISTTATTTFTDLNLNAFDGGSQKSALLELVFANGLEPRTYLASLYEQEPSDTFANLPVTATANLDCTSVEAGHACFGFLDTTTAFSSPVYVALSAKDGTTTNTIIVPYLNTVILPGSRIG